MNVSDGWRRSSRCSSESTCVEVALLDDGRVGMRDAKLSGDAPHLAFDPEAWKAFLVDVKSGLLGTME